MVHKLNVLRYIFCTLCTTYNIKSDHCKGNTTKNEISCLDIAHLAQCIASQSERYSSLLSCPILLVNTENTGYVFAKGNVMWCIGDISI